MEANSKIAAMLGVHVNTLTYKLKKEGAVYDRLAPGLHAASGEQPDYNMQSEDTQQDGAA